MFNGIKTIQMGYIAREITTNKVFYSKGANKIADKIGCNYSTVTKYYAKKENWNKDKEIRGYIISLVIEINNKSRGNNIKFNV